MVEIQELCLIAFGKFNHYTLRMEDGFNVIYGLNEAGKSTIQSFVRAMFYGFPKQRRQSGIMRDRDRALPWNEKKACGIIRVRWEKRMIEIRREFGKTASGDKIEVFDQHTGELIPELSIPDLGKILFDMPEAVFEKTVWIGQDGSTIGGKSEELTARLINLCRTGDADISIIKARNYLNDQKISLQAKDKRNNAGELDRLKEKKEALLKEKYMLESLSQQRQSAQKRIQDCKIRLTEIQQQLNEYETLQKAELSKVKRARVAQLQELRNHCSEIRDNNLYQLFHASADEDFPEIEMLAEQLKTLDLEAKIGYDKESSKSETGQYDQKKRLSYCGIGVSALLLFLAIVLFLTPVMRLWPCLLAILGVVMLALGGESLRRCRVFLSDMEQEAKRQDEVLRAMAERNQKLHAELHQYLSRYHTSTFDEFLSDYRKYQSQEEKLKLLDSTYETLLNGDDFDCLVAEMENCQEAKLHSTFTSEEIEQRLLEMRTQQNVILQEIRDIENKVAYEFTPKTNLADLEAELGIIDEDMVYLGRKYQALSLAQSVVEEAYEQMKSDFTPQVNERVNSILAYLTTGVHQQVRVSDEFYLKLVENESDLLEAEYFSMGTYQQIYFALRMSIAELIADGRIPLFLDDLLMTYDDNRAERAMQYLKDQANARQVFLFTCHKRDLDHAGRLGANLIQL